MSIMQSHYESLAKLHKRFPDSTLKDLAKKNRLNLNYYYKVKRQKDAKAGKPVVDGRRRHYVEKIEVKGDLLLSRLDKTIAILLQKASDKAKARVIDVLVDDHFERAQGGLQ